MPSSRHGQLDLPAAAGMLGRSPRDVGAFYHDVYINSMNVSFAAQALGHLLIARVVDGRFERDTEGTSERFSREDVFVIGQPHRPYAYRSAGVHLHLIGIGLTAVAEITGDPSMSVPGRLQLRGYQPVSPAAARSWNSTVDFATGLITDQGTSVSPLVTVSLACLLAASALTTFPNNAVGAPGLEQGRVSRPGTVQRAAAFIEAHAAEAISIADIAAAAFVTVRAVQLAFRRHLDTTPLEYLRRVRLERAHADLLAADPARTTVTAVAYRWGFPSASRFAAAYRHTYGITPGNALHVASRARPRRMELGMDDKTTDVSVTEPAPAGPSVTPLVPQLPAEELAQGGLEELPDDQLLPRCGKDARRDARSAAACDVLVRRYTPLVRACVRQYLGSPEPPEDLMQVGYIGLLKAIGNYDPAFGNGLRAYATPYITGEIKRHFRDKRWQVRVTRPLQELLMELRGVTEDLTNELGRLPLEDEIAKRLGVRPDELREARQAALGLSALSLNAPVGEGEDSAELGELIGAEDDNAVEHLVDMEAVERHWEELPRREQQILILRFYGNHTQQEVAARLGLSQMHVSRLQARALERLRGLLQDRDHGHQQTG